jgi:hypothetical protein
VELLLDNVAGKGDLLSPKLDPDVRQRAARAIKQRGGRVTIGEPSLPLWSAARCVAPPAGRWGSGVAILLASKLHLLLVGAAQLLPSRKGA